MEINKTFLASSIELNGSINTILVEKNIEGFIFSFFDKIIFSEKKGEIDLEYKSEIVRNSDIFSMVRDVSLFDKLKNEITLTDKEIEYINSKYFENKLNSLYDYIENKLIQFHIKNKNSFRDELISYYNEIEKKLNKNHFILYNTGKIKNSSAINTEYFRVLTNQRFSLFKETILSLKSILTNHKTHNKEELVWMNIFRGEADFISFKLLVEENNIIKPYLDFSYYFFKLLKDEKIYKVPHLFFAEWLLRNNMIKQKDFDEIVIKNNFEKKCDADYRLSIYVKYFK